MSCNDIQVQVSQPQAFNVGLGQVLETSFDHSQLSNLDYKNSGHTGFQATMSAGSGVGISDNTISVKKDNQTIIADTNGNLKTAVGGYTEQGSLVTIIDGGYTVVSETEDTKWISNNSITESNWNTYFSSGLPVSVNLVGSVTYNGTTANLNGTYTFTVFDSNTYIYIVDSETNTSIIFFGSMAGEEAYKSVFKSNVSLSNISLTATIQSEIVHQIDSKFIPFSTFLTAISGYDATKTQVLKQINGTLTWVDET